MVYYLCPLAQHNWSFVTKTGRMTTHAGHLDHGYIYRIQTQGKELDNDQNFAREG